MYGTPRRSRRRRSRCRSAWPRPRRRRRRRPRASRPRPRKPSRSSTARRGSSARRGTRPRRPRPAPTPPRRARKPPTASSPKRARRWPSSSANGRPSWRNARPRSRRSRRRRTRRGRRASASPSSRRSSPRETESFARRSGPRPRRGRARGRGGGGGGRERRAPRRGACARAAARRDNAGLQEVLRKQADLAERAQESYQTSLRGFRDAAVAAAKDASSVADVAALVFAGGAGSLRAAAAETAAARARATCVEIKQCVGCDAVLASGEEPALPRHRAGVASMAGRTTRRFSTKGVKF